jgi:hypothetical protein
MSPTLECTAKALAGTLTDYCIKDPILNSIKIKYVTQSEADRLGRSEKNTSSYKLFVKKPIPNSKCDQCWSR